MKWLPGAPCVWLLLAMPCLSEPFRALLDEESGVGAGIAVVDRDSSLYVGGVGFADRESGRPVTERSRFAVASVTKIVVGLALLQLLDERGIALDAEVASLAPELAFENIWDATDKVRVVHLLEHTTGIQEIIAGWTSGGGGAYLTARETYALGKHRAVVRWRPGTTSTYSNFNYITACALIEVLTGMSFEEFIHQRLFGPLGMTDTSFRWKGESLRVDDAFGYRAGIRMPGVPPEWFYRPAAGMISSPRDLAKLLQLLLNDGLVGTRRLIRRETLDLMERPKSSVAARAGVMIGQTPGVTRRQIRGRILYGHNGLTDGYMASLHYSRELGIGFATLLNTHPSAKSPSLARFRQAILETFFASTEGERPKGARVERKKLRELASFYVFQNPRFAPLGWGSSVIKHYSVYERGGELFRRSLLGGEERLLAFSEKTFGRDGDLEASMVFGWSEDGRRTLFEAPNSVFRAGSIFAHGALLGALGASLVMLAAFCFWLVAKVCRRRLKWTAEVRWCSGSVASFFVLIGTVLLIDASRDAVTFNPMSAALFASTVAFPVQSLIAAVTVCRRIRARVCENPCFFAAVAASCLVLSGYLIWDGLFAIRPWYWA